MNQSKSKNIDSYLCPAEIDEINYDWSLLMEENINARPHNFSKKELYKTTLERINDIGSKYWKQAGIGIAITLTGAAMQYASDAGIGMEGMVNSMDIPQQVQYIASWGADWADMIKDYSVTIAGVAHTLRSGIHASLLESKKRKSKSGLEETIEESK